RRPRPRPSRSLPRRPARFPGKASINDSSSRPPANPAGATIVRLASIKIYRQNAIDPSGSVMDKDRNRLALRLRRLKLLHFEVVLAVAECGSLTAAAAALGRSQPAVSQQLAEAEDALGVPLFTRGRQIRGTPYLPAVLRYMRRAINDTRK